MKSNNFPDKELLDMTPDMEGVTRPQKNKEIYIYCEWAW